MVREERLELSRLAAPEPKSGVSTNSTTPADEKAGFNKPALRKMVAGGRIELPTQGFSIPCSTN